MTDSPAQKLEALGLKLPKPAAPIAAYVPAVEVGGLLHISGQLPFRNGDLMTGRVGEDVNVEFGYEAARNCALMLLAQIELALGSLDRVERIVKLGVFVSSDPPSPRSPRLRTARRN
jgi:enamine deaminase RidA (YjgF/YER057c/UK114 family)